MNRRSLFSLMPALAAAAVMPKQLLAQPGVDWKKAWQAADTARYHARLYTFEHMARAFMAGKEHAPVYMLTSPSGQCAYETENTGNFAVYFTTPKALDAMPICSLVTDKMHAARFRRDDDPKEFPAKLETAYWAAFYETFHFPK